MKPAIKYWVNDKTRMCSMTMGDKEAEAENAKNGFRQVTLEEQESFRAETSSLSKGKPSLKINASAADIAKVMSDFNK
jgi:hypothetical protein